MIVQIHFDDDSKARCDPHWIHFDNSDTLTEFFENQVIAGFIEAGAHLEDEYFGVFSHDVKDSVFFKEEGLPFTAENLDTIINHHKVDVYSFCKRRKNLNIVTQAERYHPGFVKIMEKVLRAVGVELPHRLDKIVLFNLMLARGHFWQAYYDDMLKPAMEALRKIPEAYEDSNYHLIGKRDLNDGRGDRFEKAWGRRHYPFHPFICERLASIYLQLHPEYSFKQIF